jgi:phosphoglycolate phosphatase-like HAD superfamily hydrolase
MKYIVTFDIDNTLIKGSTAHTDAMIAAIGDIFGVAASIDIIRHHGMTDPEIVIRILEKCGVNDEVIRSKKDECLERMWQRYAEAVESEEIVMLGGVLNLLNRLEQEGCFLGLVTGNLEKIAHAKLEKIGIDGFFQFGGFGSDHIDRSELIKIAFQRAKKRFRLEDNLQVFHIGDAIQDMTAARDGNALPIGVTTGEFTAAELESAGAYRIVSNLENGDEILKLLVV